MITVEVKNDQGVVVRHAHIRIKADCSDATNDRGVSLGTPPAAYCTDVNSLRARTNTLLNNAAAAGRLNL